MELLPCPFCGSSNLDFTQGSTYRWMSVVCNDCGASSGETRKSILGGEFTSDDKRGAIAEWNRRASSASVPEGYAIVPVEPTMEMCEAGWNEYDLQDHFSVRFMYERMIAAAPTSPVSEDKDKIIAAANALENIASTSSSTRIRRVANDALTAIRARRNHG